MRSSKFATKIKKQGFNSFNLKSGVLGWAQNKGMFESKGKKTKKVHVYGQAWNFLPEGYEGVYAK